METEWGIQTRVEYGPVWRSDRFSVRLRRFSRRLNDTVFSLVSDSGVYAGGAFTSAGGSGANAFAKWNGASWNSLGAGINTTVHALAMSSGDLYVGGGEFSAAHIITKWHRTNRDRAGRRDEQTVSALAASGSNL